MLVDRYSMPSRDEILQTVNELLKQETFSYQKDIQTLTEELTSEVDSADEKPATA